MIPQPMQMQAEDPAAAPEAETPMPEDEPAEEEPARKIRKKKVKSGDASILSTAIYTVEDSALHIIIRRLYVIVILALAFLAGLTVRCWMTSGTYLIDELFK